MGDQQDQKVGEKRLNDRGVENGGTLKEPRVDSTDAQIIMVAVEQRNHYREVWSKLFEKHNCAVLFRESGNKLHTL